MPNLPSVRGLPIVGSLLDFKNHRLELLERIRNECGNIGSARIASDTIILLNHPDYIQQVLVEYSYDGIKPRSLRDALRPAIGESLLVIEGETHRKRRLLLAPHFQYRQVAKYANSIAHCANKMATRIAKSRTINANNEMSRYSLDVMGMTLFNTDVTNDAPEVGKALNFFAQYVNDYLASPIRIPISLPTPKNIQYKRNLSLLEQSLNRITSERIETEQDDILSTLLQIKYDDDTSIPESQSKHEALSLFIGATNTTRHSLAWMIYLIGQNKDIQRQIQEEVDSAIGRRLVEFSDLHLMPYSLQVVKETLRLYSPVYIIVRKTTKPIKIGGYDIPIGDHLIVSPYTLHRHPDYYPEPTQFRPDRFSSENDIPRYAYLPFGAGPHTCIGTHLAMLEMQIALITIAQHFTLETENTGEIGVLPLTTLQPKSAILARVTQR